MNIELHLLSWVLASALSMAASAPSVGGCGEQGLQEWKNTLEFSREEDTWTDSGEPSQTLIIQWCLIAI